MKERAIGLDLLRVGLAFLIFLFHSNISFDCQYGILTRFVGLGHISMTAFFMLSGYALEISQKDIRTFYDYKRFIIKRFASIYPLYCFVVFIYLLGWGGGSFLDKLMMLPIELLGLQAIFEGYFSVSHNGGTWFISCITFCYFLFPFFRWLIQEMSLYLRIIFFLLLCFVLLLAPLLQYHFSFASIYPNPIIRFLEFLIGILLAQQNRCLSSGIMHILQNRIATSIILFVLIVGVSYVSKYSIPHDAVFFSFIALPCFICLFLSLGSFRSSALSSSCVFRFLCDISYSFYLVQLFVWSFSHAFIKHFVGINSNTIRIVVSFFVCVLLATTLHLLIEKPAKQYILRKYIKVT